MAGLKTGQRADIAIAGGNATAKATVRLVSPEVDKITRLGKVRVTLDGNPGLRIGGFARGTITTRSVEGLAVPLAAIVFGNGESHAQVVRDNVVHTVKVVTGLQMGEVVEIVSGLKAGDLLVAKAGTFLRDGDRVNAVKAVKTSARTN